ncbi:protein kinase domain-containing protein [Methylibium rhizosphaerae]|uniref:protein kinase domain-containing protein n=1 Tax=Methylibium rhizosphaerae TaxID=2570323 RepID=UPI00112D646E|nr:protein kinase [Methylibium rhizosphaerae]
MSQPPGNSGAKVPGGASAGVATPVPPAGNDDDDEVTRIVPVSAVPQAPAGPAADRAGSSGPGSSGPVTQPLHSTGAPPAAAPQTPARHSSETLPGGARAGGLTVRQVGRYVIQDRLGRGGMATVFKAHDPGIGRDVAIKFLHATLCEDGEYRARFLREARAAGGLSHPNIVTVHDVGEIEGRPYMAMELLDGDALSDVMESGKPLPVRDVVVMGIQLARALDYAHAHGIVHRDIKPGNIVRLKGTQTIKVTDFGIAHMESTSSEQRTRVGDVLGTPQYMSPEQTQGDKLDGRSDLFSVGIVLYQMLTGQRPFLGDSLVALAMKIAKEDPPPIEKLRPDVPSALRRVVERCLAKSPDRRFQTGKELSDALTRVLGDLDEAARQKDKPRIVPLRVKWASMMALIVAGVMALAAGVIHQRQYAAMINQVTDNGAALARFIAAQNAVAALGEDWVTVEVAVQEIMKTRDFESVTVIDRSGIVRAASNSTLLGQAYKPPAAEAISNKRVDGVAMSRYAVGAETVLGFEAPITFQDKQVGRVALGLPERPLIYVARLSMGLMAVLVVVTVLAVAVAMYFVANWFAQPIKLVIESMGEIAKGRFDHRIREQRKDEFGLLYAAFDQMAQALQDRAAGAGSSSPPTPVPPARLNDPPTAPAHRPMTAGRPAQPNPGSASKPTT